MNVKEILKITNGKLICGDESAECINFSNDSRKIKKGDTYIALKGEKFDGNDFCKDSIKNGAAVCIVSKDIEKAEGVSIIKVTDTLKVLHMIATYKRNLYNMPVVAITGSVGKTSTKDLISSVVSQKYNTLKTEGNHNNEIGLPLTVLKLTDENAMVVEMGMDHLGEISRLTNIAKPTIAVITNIGTSHIGILGSVENILKAKLEILEGLQENTVVINNDDKLLHKWAIENKEKYNIITYGIKNESMYMAKDIKLMENKSTFYIDNNLIEVPVGGEHFVLNSLCAVAVGRTLNIEINEISKGIKSLQLSKNRMQIGKSKVGAMVINDTYNANYDSMKASITYLKNIQDKRRIAILGDMLNLGDYSEDLHRKIGDEVDDSIDILITVGKQALHIAENSKAKEIFSFNSNIEAINRINNIMSENDVILVKASNGMRFKEIAEAITI